MITPPLPASNAIPETPKCRTALSQQIHAATGLDRAALERLMRAFYAAAREDDMLKPMFAHVQDWEAHIARITSFWSSAALISGEYHGQPLRPHVRLNLHQPHFVRWLALFETTAGQVCTPAGAAYLMEKARRIAQSLEFGCAVARGELPVSTRA